MDDDYDEFDAADWTPGECDHCTGGEPVETPLGLIYCACQIGQGAAPEDCLCSSEDD